MSSKSYSLARVDENGTISLVPLREEEAVSDSQTPGCESGKKKVARPEPPARTVLDFLSHVNKQAAPVRRQVKLKSGRMTSAMWPGIVPDRMSVRLRYGDHITYAPGLTWQFYLYELSGLYDPNVTGVGAQPNGFDQWMAFYSNFIVRKARVRTITNGVSVGVGTAGFPNVAGVVTGTAGDILGTPLCVVSATNPNGPPADTHSEWIELHEFVGLTLDEYRATEDYWGTSSANPTKKVYWTTLTYALDFSTAITGSRISLIEFDVEFFNRVNLAQS